jgi:hypothetical protein
MKLQQSSERGQVLVIIVFAMFGLIGITGLAIDGSRAYSDRQARRGRYGCWLLRWHTSVRPDEDWTPIGYRALQ